MGGVVSKRDTSDARPLAFFLRNSRILEFFLGRFFASKKMILAIRVFRTFFQTEIFFEAKFSVAGFLDATSPTATRYRPSRAANRFRIRFSQAEYSDAGSRDTRSSDGGSRTDPRQVMKAYVAGSCGSADYWPEKFPDSMLHEKTESHNMTSLYTT
jgi:hypothetical protein